MANKKHEKTDIMKTRFFALAALVLSLAACTRDEADFLPEGTPIVFIATGLTPHRYSRRHPCPSERQLGGCAKRGSPDEYSRIVQVVAPAMYISAVFGEITTPP